MGKYTANKTVQMLIAILKGHGIKNVVISPGTTNFMFVASLQSDSWFNLWSSPDERSAAYIACGLAAETGEPVVLSCTGATASRNYLPALTEAFYRKLPVLAITSINISAIPGQNTPQVIDRSQLPRDVVKLSVDISEVYDKQSSRKCTIFANQAVLELFRHGGGPVHINLTTKMTSEFTADKLPDIRIVRRHFLCGQFPSIDKYEKIGIYIGSHRPFVKREQDLIDKFCEKYNAIVLCDQTSNYRGKYRFLSAYVASQEHINRSRFEFDLFIDLGEVSGDYYLLEVKEVWRVSADGELKDRFGKLTEIFEMSEEEFFEHYIKNTSKRVVREDNFEKLKNYDIELRKKTPEIPFSNIWIAKITASKIPKNSVLHFGILNSLRAWNFYDTPDSVTSFCNVGGFGIDGGVSTLLGASLVHPEKLYFGFIGDLAFFYDMNSLGNRHVDSNFRLMVINNGKGTEFRNYSHPASALGDGADRYIAAAGHYGSKSAKLLNHYAKDLGFKYLTASSKDEFKKNIMEFTSPTLMDKPLLFEVFTSSCDESEALWILRNTVPESYVKSLAKNTLGEKGYKFLTKSIRGK